MKKTILYSVVSAISIPVLVAILLPFAMSTVSFIAITDDNVYNNEGDANFKISVHNGGLVQTKNTIIEMKFDLTADNNNVWIDDFDILDDCLEGDMQFLSKPNQRFLVYLEHFSPGVKCDFIISLSHHHPITMNFTQTTITSDGMLAKVNDIPRLGDLQIYGAGLVFSIIGIVLSARFAYNSLKN